MRTLVLLFLVVLFVAPLRAQPPRPSGLRFTCGTEEKAREKAQQWLGEASASPAEAAVDRVAGERAYHDAVYLHERLLAGQVSPDIYSEISHLIALSKAAKTERVRILFDRAAHDQLTRLDFQAAIMHQAWAAGLSENATDYAFVLIGREGCGVDASDTAWLKEEIQKNGWFLASRDGPEAEDAAWLMVQHADQDLPFQKEILALIEPLAHNHQADPTHYAYLYDRVAVGDGRPQRFGTQGLCNEKGFWEPRPSEDVALLDSRRASVGLPPEALYASKFHCRASVGH